MVYKRLSNKRVYRKRRNSRKLKGGSVNTDGVMCYPSGKGILNKQSFKTQTQWNSLHNKRSYRKNSANCTEHELVSRCISQHKSFFPRGKPKLIIPCPSKSKQGWQKKELNKHKNNIVARTDNRNKDYVRTLIYPPLKTNAPYGVGCDGKPLKHEKDHYYCEGTLGNMTRIPE